MGTCYSCSHSYDNYDKISSNDIFITEPPPSAFPNDESDNENDRNDFDIIDFEEINNMTPRKQFRITLPKFMKKSRLLSKDN